MGIINIPAELFAKENRMRFAISVALAGSTAILVKSWYFPVFDKSLYYSLCIPLLFCVYWFLLEGSVDIRNGVRKYAKKKKLKLRAFLYNPLDNSDENIKYWKEYEELYKGYFSEEFGDPTTSETLKWLIDTARKYPYKKGDDLDLMIFAKSKSRICGFLKIYYIFRSNNFAYFSYVLNKEEARDAVLIVPEMIKKLNQILKDELQGCLGIVGDTGKYDKLRIELFQKRAKRFFHSTLWNLNDYGLEYELPCTEPNDEFKSETRKPTTLLYIRTKNHANYNMGNHPGQEEIRQILHFVYKVVYANCFPEDKEKNERYRKYAEGIHNRVWPNYLKTIKLHEVIPS